MTHKIGLFLGAEAPQGGVFQYCQALLEAAAALPQDQYKVVVGYGHEGWAAHVADYALPAVHIPVRARSLLAGRIWKRLGLPMALWRRLTPLFHPVARRMLDQQCDLWVFPSQDVWTYQVPVPALGVIHDLMHRYERRFPEAGGQYAFREHHYGNICRFSVGILVDSEIGRMHVQESYGTSAEKIHVLPYVPPKYIHSPIVPADVETQYHLPAKFVFYPAQFWEHKNHKRLVRAIARLKAEHPDIHLVLAGSQKNGYDSTRALVVELGLDANVHFLGYVPDEVMPTLYQRARALIMPTFFGPTNIPPLEAFALGCPVAISGIYGMPEQLGDAALYFDPESEAGIAEAIGRLWTDDALCQALIERGQARTRVWGSEQFNARFRAILDQGLAARTSSIQLEATRINAR